MIDSIVPYSGASQIDSDSKNNQSTPRKNTEAELREASAQIESLFVSYLLKTMRETSVKSGLFGNGAGSQIYTEMFEVEIAKKISESRGLGLGDAVFNQLIHHIEPTEQK